MNQAYVYDEAENEEGLTFKKIGYFLKKSWLRMLIYAVVLALVVTAVAVPIKIFYKSEEVAQTSIEFIYDGIEKGQDPNGGLLNSDNIISTTVLNEAVKASRLEKTIKDIASLRSSMRVEGVETDEYVKLVQAAADGDKDAANRLRNYTMIPTRFNIIISEPSELGLSDDQAKLLLDNVVKSYYADFQKRFSVTEMFASDMYTLSQNDQLEFTDIYDMYVVSLNAIKSYLTDMAAENPSYVSTINNATFTQLLSELNIISSNYDMLNAYVLSNNIWRAPEAARDALDAMKTEIDNRLTPLRDYITALSDQISKIQPNTTTTDNGGTHNVTVSYPPEYFVYQARLDEANRQVRDYEVQLANIATRKEKLTDVTSTDAALISSATERMSAIEGATEAFVTKVNATIQDYYATTFLSSSVRTVQPSVVTRRSSNLNLLIIYIVAVIAGVLIASIVTGVKISKANSAAKKRDAAASDETAPVAEQDNE